MRIKSREQRRGDAFDKKFDESITILLIQSGFIEEYPYIFTRQQPSGYDVIYFDIEGKSFIVQVSYVANYLKEVLELYKSYEPIDIGPFSYVTPKIMTFRPKEFPCKLAKVRDKSIELTAKSIQEVAIPWLETLKDKVQYAKSMPPTAILLVARACEEANLIEQAKTAYEEVLRRELACLSLCKGDLKKFSKQENNKVFVYVCYKLQKEMNKAKTISEIINYEPKTKILKC